MEAKEYLMQLKGIDSLIETLSEELENAEQMIAPSGISISDVPEFSSGHVSDKTGSAAIRIEELKEELRQQKKKYVDMKCTATRLINQMENVKHKTMLYQYYLKNRTLEGTAGYMNYSYQNICRIHGKALIEFQKLMDKEGVS